MKLGEAFVVANKNKILKNKRVTPKKIRVTMDTIENRLSSEQILGGKRRKKKNNPMNKIDKMSLKTLSLNRKLANSITRSEHGENSRLL